MSTLQQLFKRRPKKPPKPKVGFRNTVSDEKTTQTEPRKQLAMLYAMAGIQQTTNVKDFVKADNELIECQKQLASLEASRQALTDGKDLKVFREEVKRKIKLLQEEIPGKVREKANQERAVVRLMELEPTDDNKPPTLNGNDHPKIWRKGVFNWFSCCFYFLVAFVAMAGEFVLSRGPVSRVFGEHGWGAFWLAASVVALAFLLKPVFESQIERRFYQNPDSKVYQWVTVGMGIFGLVAIFCFVPIRNGSVEQDQITQNVLDLRAANQQQTLQLRNSGADSATVAALETQAKATEHSMIQSVSPGSGSLEGYQTQLYTDPKIKWGFTLYVLALAIIAATSFSMGHIIFKVLIARGKAEHLHQAVRTKMADLDKHSCMLNDIQSLMDREKVLRKQCQEAQDLRDTCYTEMHFQLGKQGYFSGNWTHDKADILSHHLQNTFPELKD